LLVVFRVCAAISLASAPWVLARQRRRVDDLSSLCSWAAALPGMLLFVDTTLLREADWWSWDLVWPFYVLGMVWGAFWVFGGPWLLRMAAAKRRLTPVPFTLELIQFFHAGCWLTSTVLSLAYLLFGFAWLAGG